MTDIPIKLLVGTSAVSAFYALLLDVRKQKQVRRLAAHIKDRDGDKWAALPSLHRAMPRVALRILFRAETVHDAESLDMYRRLRIGERRQMAALAACALAIAVLLFGTRFWGWTW